MKLRPEFTQMARDAVLAAQSDAARAGEVSISPERLLLGVFKQPAPGVVYILTQAGVDAGRVQDLVRQQIKGRGSGPVKIDNVTLGASVRRVLDYALEESRNACDTYIRPDYLLLGIVRNEAGFAFETLKELGMDLACARSAAHRFRAHEILRTIPPMRRRRKRPPAESASGPKEDDRPVCEMGKFADPAAASAWLNEMAAKGYQISRASATQGEIWLTVERGPR